MEVHSHEFDNIIRERNNPRRCFNPAKDNERGCCRIRYIIEVIMGAQGAVSVRIWGMDNLELGRPP